MVSFRRMADGSEWTIPAARYTGQDGKSAHAHLIPLSPLAREIIAKTPVHLVGGKPSRWIFTTTGRVLRAPALRLVQV